MEASDLLTPVSTRLWQVLRLIISSHPLALINIGASSVLEAFPINLEDSAHSNIVSKVSTLLKRFSWLRRAELAEDAISSDQLEPVTLLDKIEPPYSFGCLASALMSSTPSVQKIITLILHWASSVYRVGRQRLYLATGLLREYLSRDADNQKCMLISLGILSSNNSLDRRSVAEIMAELIRSRHFDVGQYLRTLIANGVLGRPKGDKTVSQISPVISLRTLRE